MPPPDQSASSAIIASIAAGSRRSAPKCRVPPLPAASTSAMAAAICPGVPRPLIATLAPACASPRAIASPMPEVLPVTRAVRPERKVSAMRGSMLQCVSCIR